VAYPKYDDGLDADGFPVNDGPWRKPFVHGDESEAGDWQPLTLVNAAADALERINHLLNLSGNTDSPIETNIGAAVLMFFERAGLSLKLCKMVDIRNAPDALLLVPQFAWGYYRSDWAILNPKNGGALLIECDGKEFHSSDEQRAHDAKKDAAALDRGFLTMRFTGSQIHRDPDGCAQKIFDAVCGL
jgi:very-short-patch-repair endonuclease